jgi:hypothetical protein
MTQLGLHLRSQGVELLSKTDSHGLTVHLLQLAFAQKSTKTQSVLFVLSALETRLLSGAVNVSGCLRWPPS